MNKNPLAGSSLLAYPLEGHPFTVNPLDDYRCLLCHRPRALHADPQDPEPGPKEIPLAPPPREGHHKSGRSPNGHRRS